MYLALAIFICCIAINNADSTARMLNTEGYFKVFGLSNNASASHFHNEIDKTHLMAVQTELDRVLDFVSWKMILTAFTSLSDTESSDHDNDDYVTGKLEFRIEAFLAPEDNAAEYFAEIVRTLNDILSEGILFGTESEELLGARIPVGSLTMYDEVRLTDGHTFRPSSSPIVSPEKLHLLMLGDWGKGGIPGDITATATSSLVFDMGRKLAKNGGTDYTYQASVARSMMKYAKFINLSAVITLGDNFYNSGVTSTTDTMWTTIWRDVYLTEGSPLNVPWYTVLGNHDYGSASNAEAQINRYKRNDNDDNNWIMPSHNYTKIFEIAGGGSVRIIFIDTTTLAPSVNKCCNEKGGVSLVQQALLINNQLQYIESELQKAAIDQPSWLIVAGHYPVFSAGEHGDTNELKTYLLPLLQKYNVDAYMCGHDHISEHLEKQGVNYFVAGAGALTDKIGSKGSEGNLVWAGAGYSAFAAVAATEESLTVSFINIHGESVYAHTISKIEEMALEEKIKEEAEAKLEEEEDSTAWILDSLGVDNTSQAAAKLSSITILCILISVTIVLVLDANFVARIKRAEAASSLSEDRIGGDDTAGKHEGEGEGEGLDVSNNRTVNVLREGSGQKVGDGPRDSIPGTAAVKSRGFLEGSIFGKHTYAHLSPSYANERKESFSSSKRWNGDDECASKSARRGEIEIAQNMLSFGGSCKELFSV